MTMKVDQTRIATYTGWEDPTIMDEYWDPQEKQRRSLQFSRVHQLGLLDPRNFDEEITAEEQEWLESLPEDYVIPQPEEFPDSHPPDHSYR